MSSKYDSLLKDFTALCQDLTASGMPYLTVILCHELYRYLYPVEPFENFTHTQPVAHSTKHIQGLIAMAKQFRKIVHPYEAFDLKKFNPASIPGAPLEKRTSDLYSDLWKRFDKETLSKESVALLKKRIPEGILNRCIRGKVVLDMGCGSGRYSIALAALGAEKVIAVDVQKKSYAASEEICRKHRLPVEFREANVHSLPFPDTAFDFVFSNGVLHHTSSIQKGVQELKRVLKQDGNAFLYIYGAGGIFWKTRLAMREIFKKIPFAYTYSVLENIGLPSNRFVFCDTWYVPVETHTTTRQIEGLLDKMGFDYKKLISQVNFDLEKAALTYGKQGSVMWGDGDHRYLLSKN